MPCPWLRHVLRPVIGGKVLAVSNTQFTIRELGDNAVEEGDVWRPRGRINAIGVLCKLLLQAARLVSK